MSVPGCVLGDSLCLSSLGTPTLSSSPRNIWRFRGLFPMRLSYTRKDLLGNGGYGKLFERRPERRTCSHSSPDLGKVFAAKVTSTDQEAFQNNVGETNVALKKARVTNHVRHPVLLHEARVLILLRGKSRGYEFPWLSASISHNAFGVFSWIHFQDIQVSPVSSRGDDRNISST